MKLKVIFLVATCGVTSSAWAKFIENTDITSYVNQLIKQQKVVSIPAGTYKIDANKSIIPKNGSEIKLDPRTKLTVIPTKHGSYRVFQVKNVENVKISGGSLIGDKYTHLGNAGEWGMGIEIRDSKNISISDMNIDKMWGDAIYVGTNGKNSNYNINLNNIRMDDNRRQGLTIISAKKLIGDNIHISNTKGADPASGIDIEPNNKNNILQEIYFKKLNTTNNAGSGFIVSLKSYINSINPISIKLENHIDKGSNFGFVVRGNPTSNVGTIEIKNTNYKENKHSNFCFNQWNNKVNVYLNNIKHDKQSKFKKHSWCLDYNKQNNIKLAE